MGEAGARTASMTMHSLRVCLEPSMSLAVSRRLSRRSNGFNPASIAAGGQINCRAPCFQKILLWYLPLLKTGFPTLQSFFEMRAGMH